MTKSNIEFKGSSMNFTDLYVMVVIALIIPTMFGLNFFSMITIYLIELNLLYLYLRSNYSVVIENGELVRKCYFNSSKTVFVLTNSNISKVYFGFPSIKGLPVSKIYFKEPSSIIKIVTINTGFLNELHNFVIQNNIKCEIYPPEAKKRFNVL